MRRPSFLLLAGVALVTAIARAETLDEAVRAMTNAEKKFYETGQEKGTRAAFLEFLAPDAIIFRPGPVNGQEAWSKRPESGLDLVWEPTFAAIARSGDFGYDTGPSSGAAKRATRSSPASDISFRFGKSRRTVRGKSHSIAGSRIPSRTSNLP
jgi:hypothetical protein